MVSETMLKAKAPPADVQARPPVMAAAPISSIGGRQARPPMLLTGAAAMTGGLACTSVGGALARYSVSLTIAQCLSSVAGRAPAQQAEGRGFKSHRKRHWCGHRMAGHITGATGSHSHHTAWPSPTAVHSVCLYIIPDKVSG